MQLMRRGFLWFTVPGETVHHGVGGAVGALRQEHEVDGQIVCILKSRAWAGSDAGLGKPRGPASTDPLPPERPLPSRVPQHFR